MSLTMLLENAMTSFLELYGSRMGNVQTLDMEESHRVLEIKVQRGFSQSFLQAFARVSADDDTACGRALRVGKTVVIPDVEADAGFAPYLAVARQAGFRAVVSTPIVSEWGHVVGVISTHFPECHAPPMSAIHQGEFLARRLAFDILAAARPETEITLGANRDSKPQQSPPPKN